MRIQIQQAIRRSLRAPGFALAVLLLVAAVVLVNATAFSAIHALRWKALPYAEGDQLVELRANLRNFGFEVGLSPSLYEQVRADTSVFAAAVGSAGQARRLADEGDHEWRIQRVTHDFDQALGVAPMIGRAFAQGDAVEGREQLLVLSEAAWRSRFGGDPGVLGKTLSLAGGNYTVVGVMPAGFVFPDAGADAWMPFVASADERAQDAGGNVGAFEVAGRLAPGVTVDQARERLHSILATAENLAGIRQSAGLQADARLWRDRFAATHFQALALLQLAALMLLAVVAANLGNLTLDRIVTRRREFAVCRALGARRRDVFASVAADVALPALAGTLLGIAAVPIGVSLLRSRELLPAELPVDVVVGPVTALGALGLVIIVVGVAVTIASFAVARPRRGNGLNERSRAAGLGRSRAAILIGQVALCVALVGSAGLLLRSAINVVKEERGFDPEGVLVTAIDPVGVSRGAHFDPKDDGSAWRPQLAQLVAAADALPGASRSAVSSMTPFSSWESVSNFRVATTEGDQQGRSRDVGPDYFAVLGIPLIAGREFRESDIGESSPVIVDALFRDRFLQGLDPLESSVQVPIGEGRMRDARIVGVAATVKHKSLDETAGMPTVYMLNPIPLPVFFLSVRTAGDPAALAEPLRRLVREQLPDADILVSQPLTAAIAKTLTSRRALVEAVGLFAIMTLLMSALGLYAVLGFAVRRRTAEIGVRMALGANRSRILLMVMGQGGAMVAAGVTLGLVLGLPIARLLADRLYKLTPGDPETWFLAASAVATTAMFACWWPARRASRVPPQVALRSE
jgi:putative ABC transport system permease protein